MPLLPKHVLDNIALRLEDIIPDIEEILMEMDRNVLMVGVGDPSDFMNKVAIEVTPEGGIISVVVCAVATINEIIANVRSFVALLHTVFCLFSLNRNRAGRAVRHRFEQHVCRFEIAARPRASAR